jgi:hypothetical protein
MSEVATAARPVGILAKTARRVGDTLALSVGVALLLWSVWKSGPISLLFCTMTLGLAATAVFALFEAWPRKLPRWIERWVLEVVAVGVATPATALAMHLRPVAPPLAPPSWQHHDWLLLTRRRRSWAMSRQRRTGIRGA